MRIFVTFLLGLTCASAVSAFAQYASGEAVRIVDFGIYDTSKQSPELLVDTDTIPAEVGTVFGIRVMLDSESSALYSFRWTFPAMRNPANGQVWTEMTGSTELTGDRAQPIFARINHEWESVPGEWTVEVLEEDRVLVKKVFHLRVTLNDGVSGGGPG